MRVGRWGVRVLWRYSQFTLALAEDSGWYRANWDLLAGVPASTRDPRRAGPYERARGAARCPPSHSDRQFCPRVSLTLLNSKRDSSSFFIYFKNHDFNFLPNYYYF